MRLIRSPFSSFLGRRAPFVIVLATLGSVLLAPLDTDAATHRIHHITFNTCDQVGNPNADEECQSNDVKTRAKAIVNSIQDFPADVVALQEVCKTTFIEVRDNLGPGWDSYFLNTASHSDLCAQSSIAR